MITTIFAEDRTIVEHTMEIVVVAWQEIRVHRLAFPFVMVVAVREISNGTARTLDNNSGNGNLNEKTLSKLGYRHRFRKTAIAWGACVMCVRMALTRGLRHVRAHEINSLYRSVTFVGKVHGRQANIILHMAFHGLAVDTAMRQRERSTNILSRPRKP